MLVTGGAGFIGSHLVDKLVSLGAEVRVADDLTAGSLDNFATRRDDFDFVKVDLREPDACHSICGDIDIVMHLAAKVAGVSYNTQNSARMFFENSTLNVNMLDASRRANIERYLVMSSACVYRRDCSIPTPESEGFVGEPDPSNWGYGWAKRFSEVQGRLYRQDYGMNISVVRPYNTYGPRDHFDTESSHVIPSLIRKMMTPDNDEIVLWGNGTQSRSFVYVTDLVDGIMLATEKCVNADPVNLGTDEEVTVKELFGIISTVVRRKFQYRFDHPELTGQPRRRPDLAKAYSMGYRPKFSLSEGIEQTVEWYNAEFKPHAESQLMPS